MKFNRRKIFLVASVVFVLLVIVSIAFTNNPGTTAAGDVPSMPNDVDSPQLVVPETPFGMIGVFTAIVAAIGVYSILIKNKKNQ